MCVCVCGGLETRISGGICSPWPTGALRVPEIVAFAPDEEGRVDEGRNHGFGVYVELDMTMGG